jgi:SAM-dependent methyltransferase
MTIEPDKWSTPWQNPEVPKLQGDQASVDFYAWLAGTAHPAFDALKEIVSSIPDDPLRFAEIGSGSGYNSAVIKHVRPNWKYHGIELSRPMIEYAREKWPGYYEQGDAMSLPDSVVGEEIVMLGAVIQHVPDWRKAVSEAARVSSHWVLLHRVQCTLGDTNEFSNAAYGVELPTRENNEAELLEHCESVGLKLVDTVKWGDVSRAFNATFLFEKS